MPLSLAAAVCLVAALLAAPTCQAEVSGSSLMQVGSSASKVLAPQAQVANGTNATPAAPKAEAPQEEPKMAAKVEPEANKTEEEPKVEAPPEVCVTRQDPRARAWWSKTAQPGTPCVFGADLRDEGKHCIPELKYGSMGWCYTKKDGSEWGSCSDGCPLYGPHRVIGKSIDGVSDKLDGIVADLTKAAEPVGTATAAPSNQTDAPKNATAANGTNATKAAAPKEEPKPAALSETKAQATKVEKKEKQGSPSSMKAVSLAQTASSTRSTSMVQIDAASALAQKAERQTELWTGIAQRVLEMDASLEDEDSIPLAQEALKKARAWQKIAGKEGARVTALMQVEMAHIPL